MTSAPMMGVVYRVCKDGEMCAARVQVGLFLACEMPGITDVLIASLRHQEGRRTKDKPTTRNRYQRIPAWHAGVLENMI